MGRAHERHGGKGDTIHHATSLITDGLYAYARHPYYMLAPPLLWGALALLTNSWVPLLGGVAFVTFLATWAAPIEEEFLAQRFGAEWDAYAARVPRWGLGHA